MHVAMCCQQHRVAGERHRVATDEHHPLRRRSRQHLDGLATESRTSRVDHGEIDRPRCPLFERCTHHFGVRHVHCGVRCGRLGTLHHDDLTSTEGGREEADTAIRVEQACTAAEEMAACRRHGAHEQLSGERTTLEERRRAHPKASAGDGLVEHRARANRDVVG